MMDRLFRINLLLLLMVALFDPSDLLVHAKVPLFTAIWIIAVIEVIISSRGLYPVPANLYLYAFIFVVLIPLIGILVYVLRGGGMEGYEGFKYLKSYLFLSLCIPLAIKRIDLVRTLSFLLTILSALTIFIYSITVNDELIRGQLALFGDVFTIFSVTERTYANLSYESVYFHSSPLLVLAVVYFCYRFLHSVGKMRWYNFVLLVLNIGAMILSGTRNNIIMSVIAPLMVIAWYRPGRPRLIVGVILSLVVVVGIGSGVMQAMVSPDENSNSVKLDHLHDYAWLFADWRTLLFGQGLGAAFFSSAWGAGTTLTELSYLEIIRNYGLIFSPILFALVFFPLKVLADQRARSDHYLLIGYGCYLYLCSANPLLLSSTGMLALSIVLRRTFCGPAALSARIPDTNLRPLNADLA